VNSLHIAKITFYSHAVNFVRHVCRGFSQPAPTGRGSERGLKRIYTPNYTFKRWRSLIRMQIKRSQIQKNSSTARQSTQSQVNLAVATVAFITVWPYAKIISIRTQQTPQEQQLCTRISSASTKTFISGYSRLQLFNLFPWSKPIPGLNFSILPKLTLSPTRASVRLEKTL
jgi:hypothetical protein